MRSDAPIAESRLADSADRKYEPCGLMDGSKTIRIVGRSLLLHRLPPPRYGAIHEAVNRSLRPRLGSFEIRILGRSRSVRVGRAFSSVCELAHTC
jgi:hypothetical protein